MINIINLRILNNLTFRMLVNIHRTFSKVTVKIFYNYTYNSDKGSGTEIKKNNLNNESIKENVC